MEFVRRDEPEAAPEAAPAPRSTATDAPAVLALQRSAGNQAVAGAFELAASGAATEVPRRREMETAFGTSFAGVRAYLGGSNAQAGLGALGANAAARGEEVAFRDASPPEDLIAHELAHVVQQRRGQTGVACSSDRQGSAAENAARRAASAVARGERVPDVGAAAPGDVQLNRVQTAGGEWWWDRHRPDGLGADVILIFWPRDPVIAEKIGLFQTVTTLRRDEKGKAAVRTDDPKDYEPSTELPPGSKDPGRHVDQTPNKYETLPNTNPLYATQNPHGSTVPAGTNLNTPDASSASGQHGWLYYKNGERMEQPASLKDNPGRPRSANAVWDQRFEVAAIAIQGPLAGMYLGSVAWGWQSDENDNVTLHPLTVVREGTPSAALMDAVRRWNETTLLDTKTGTRYETVDLPVAASDPGSMPTHELNQALLNAAASGADQQRKDFEVLALKRELAKRIVDVTVNVGRTNDDEFDDIYVELSHGGASADSKPWVKLKATDSRRFSIPLAKLALPITGPIKVTVFDHDWMTRDDPVVTLDWTPPAPGAADKDEPDGPHYTMTVAYR
jgi:uncharacterized protein DUF4157